MANPKDLRAYGTEFMAVGKILVANKEVQIDELTKTEAKGIQRRFYGWRTALTNAKARGELTQEELAWEDVAARTVVTVRETRPNAYVVDFQVGRAPCQRMQEVLAQKLAQLEHVPSGTGQVEQGHTASREWDVVYAAMTPEVFAQVWFMSPTGQELGQGWTGYMALCQAMGVEPTPAMIRVHAPPGFSAGKHA